MTDEHTAYNSLDATYDRMYTNHKRKQYVNGEAHTNGLENFWSQIKRGTKGVNHHVSRKHLQRYCDEYAFRHNTRKEKEGSRFNIALLKTRTQLTYKQLTRK